MHGLERERLENEHVERALNERVRLILRWHRFSSRTARGEQQTPLLQIFERKPEAFQVPACGATPDV